jgi:hypothetical protein
MQSYLYAIWLDSNEADLSISFRALWNAIEVQLSRLFTGRHSGGFGVSFFFFS